MGSRAVKSINEKCSLTTITGVYANLYAQLLEHEGLSYSPGLVGVGSSCLNVKKSRSPSFVHRESFHNRTKETRNVRVT